MPAEPQRWVRLVAAQGVWLRDPLLLVATGALIALPLALAALHARTGAGSLASQLIQFDERVLPLWVLVAVPRLWSDGQPPHRELLLSWPATAWEIVASKVVAALWPFVALCGLTAWELPHLYRWATGVPVSALGDGPGFLSFHLLFSRPLAVGALLLAFVTVGGMCGVPWAGVTVAALIWLVNAMSVAPWVDALAGGALNLFAWSGGTAHELSAVTLRTLAAGGTLLALATMAWGTARDAGFEGLREAAWRWVSLVRWQVLFLRHPALLTAVLVISAIPVFLLLLYWAGRLTALQLVDGLREFHERYLPLAGLVAGGVVWADAADAHRPIFASWPVRLGRLIAAKTLVVAAFFLAMAAVAAGLSEMVLGWVVTSASPGASVLPAGIPPAKELLLRPLVPASLLLACTTLGGALGSPWGGIALGAGWWMLEVSAGRYP